MSIRSNHDLYKSLYSTEPYPLLHFVRDWGSVPSEPLLLPPPLRIYLDQHLSYGLLSAAPTPYSEMYVLNNKSLPLISLPTSTAIPKEAARTRILFAYLAYLELRRRGWSGISRCRGNSVYRLSNGGSTALLHVLLPPVSTSAKRTLSDIHQCGGSRRPHSSYFWFAGLMDLRYNPPGHLTALRSPYLTYWLQRLEDSAVPYYHS